MVARMQDLIVNTLAAASVGVVALYPSPDDFWKAMTPAVRTPAVAIQDIDARHVDMELLHFSEPRVQTVLIPRIGSCDYPLSEMDAALIRACEEDLAIVAAYDVSEGVDTAREKARLALIRLCQAEWSEPGVRKQSDLPTSCDSVF